jgi:hypothetical protein
MADLNWIPVASSNLSFVAYDEPNQSLYIEFRSGRRYVYVNVPEIEFENLLNAPSQGIYFNSHIKNFYPGSPI